MKTIKVVSWLFAARPVWEIVPAKRFAWLSILLVALFPAQAKSSYDLIRLNQTFPITGMVTAETGIPISGASIVVQGAVVGTVTKEDGSFALSVPNGNSVLIVSAVGYTEQSVPINGRSEVNVVLITSQNTLDQVVVVGYGTQRKTSLTASISTVKGSEIAQQPVSDLSNAL